MKFKKKQIALLMSLALLSGCSKGALKIENGNEKVVNGTESSVVVSNIQKLYEQLYADNGTTQATKVIIDEIAQKVLLEAYGDEGAVAVAVNKKIKEYFKNYYIASYKVDGYFNESLLVTALRGQGYYITGDDRFVETYDLVNNPNYKYEYLYDYLKADYSDLINRKLRYDAHFALLNEQYVLSEKKTLFTTARIRKVEFVALPTTGVDSEDDILLAKYQEKIDSFFLPDSNKTFKELALSLEKIYNNYKFDKLAEDFAPINYKALQMDAGDKTYGDGDFYNYLAKDFEFDYTDKYINIYSATKRYKQIPTFTCEGSNCTVSVEYVEDILGDYESSDGTTFVKVTPYLKSDVDGVKSKMGSYSGNGSHSIYRGYESKQQDILATKYYEEKIGLNTASFGTTITATIDAKVFRVWDDIDFVTAGGEKTSLLDFNGTNKPIFKLDGKFYLVKVSQINNNSADALKEEAAKPLASVSANVKDALKHYFDKYKLVLHEQDLYDYLSSTYGFSK